MPKSLDLAMAIIATKEEAMEATIRLTPGEAMAISRRGTASGEERATIQIKNILASMSEEEEAPKSSPTERGTVTTKVRATKGSSLTITTTEAKIEECSSIKMTSSIARETLDTIGDIPEMAIGRIAKAFPSRNLMRNTLKWREMTAGATPSPQTTPLILSPTRIRTLA
jgi:hypothetical protein